MSEVAKIEPQSHAPADPMVAMIERVAMQAGVPVDRLNALMDMRERQMNKEAEQVFNRAFAAAMAEMGDVPRTGQNKHLGTRYSTLDDLIRATRPVLSKHGLSLNWQSSIDGQNISVTAIVRHADGHSISTTLSGPRDTGPQMNALQGGGSTETYLKRYSGFSLLGLSSGDEVDDDGQGSGGITAEQFRALRGLIEQASVDEDRLCAAYGIQHLQELPASKYADAEKRLRLKLAKNGGAQ